MKTIDRFSKVCTEPGELLQHPWCFTIGQEVYVAGRPQYKYKVLGGELWVGFPHLHLLDESGQTWRIPQLHVSSKPILA